MEERYCYAVTGRLPPELSTDSLCRAVQSTGIRQRKVTSFLPRSLLPSSVCSGLRIPEHVVQMVQLRLTAAAVFALPAGLLGDCGLLPCVGPAPAQVHPGTRHRASAPAL